MGRKRHRNETEEERIERKRRRKEAKAKSKEKSSGHQKQDGSSPGDARAGAESVVENEGGATRTTSPVFFKKRLEMTVSLLPAGMRNVIRSVEDSLRKFLLKYSDGIDGILLAFDNVRILGDGGLILNELPHVHFAICCDGIVFKPAVGCTLTGVVTESFHSHLSLIVHGYFNASIPASCLRSNRFNFDETSEQWCVESSSESMTVGETKIEFQVARIYESAGIISLEGSQPSLNHQGR